MKMKKNYKIVLIAIFLLLVGGAVWSLINNEKSVVKKYPKVESKKKVLSDSSYDNNTIAKKRTRKIIQEDDEVIDAVSVNSIKKLPKSVMQPLDDIFDSGNPNSLKRLSPQAFKTLGEHDRKLFDFINRQRVIEGLEPLDIMPTGLDTDEVLLLWNGLRQDENKSLFKEMPMGLKEPAEKDKDTLHKGDTRLDFVPPSDRGLMLLNKERATKNLPPLSMEEAVRIAKEKIKKLKINEIKE